MNLVRHEYDVTTGIRTVIDQTAYRSEDDVILVLDSIEPTPDGFSEISPEDIAAPD